MTAAPANDDTRRRLLDQGVALMLERGYNGAGLADILKAANVPKGSFYHYFESKEAFGAQVIAHYLAPFLQRLRAHLSAPGRDGLSALEAYFNDLATDLAANDFKGGCLLGNLMGEIGDSSPASRDALREAVGRYRDLLAQGVARAQQEGAARLDRSPESLANLLVDGWQGALLRMKIERSDAPLRAFIDETLLAHCRAVARPAA